MNKNISNERLLKILVNLFDWAFYHSDGFFEDFVNASEVTQEELDILGEI